MSVKIQIHGRKRNTQILRRNPFKLGPLIGLLIIICYFGWSDLKTICSTLWQAFLDKWYLSRKASNASRVYQVVQPVANVEKQESHGEDDLKKKLL